MAPNRDLLRAFSDHKSDHMGPGAQPERLSNYRKTSTIVNARIQNVAASVPTPA
jgi:hypothetical protein